MWDKLSVFFAGSWKTTVIGWAEAAIPVMIEEIRNGGGLPKDTLGWLLYAAAVLRATGGTATKDANKTNAPMPTPTPQTLSMTTGEVK